MRAAHSSRAPLYARAPAGPPRVRLCTGARGTPDQRCWSTWTFPNSPPGPAGSRHGAPHAVTVGADGARVAVPALRRPGRPRPPRCGCSTWPPPPSAEVAPGPVDSYAVDPRRPGRWPGRTTAGCSGPTCSPARSPSRRPPSRCVDPRPDPTGRRIGYVDRRPACLRVVEPDGADELLAGEPGGQSWGVPSGRRAGLRPSRAAAGSAATRGWWWPPGRHARCHRRRRTRRRRTSGQPAPARPRRRLGRRALGPGDLPVPGRRALGRGRRPLITVLRRMQQHGLVLAVDPRTGETQVHAELADAALGRAGPRHAPAPARRPGAGRRRARPRRLRRPLPVRRRQPAHPARPLRPPGRRGAAAPGAGRPGPDRRGHRRRARRAARLPGPHGPGRRRRRAPAGSPRHPAGTPRTVGGDVLVVGPDASSRGAADVLHRCASLRGAAAVRTRSRSLERVTDRRLPAAVLYPAAPPRRPPAAGAARPRRGPGPPAGGGRSRPPGRSGSGGPTPASPWSASTPGVRPEWRPASRRWCTAGWPTWPSPTRSTRCTRSPASTPTWT